MASAIYIYNCWLEQTPNRQESITWILEKSSLHMAKAPVSPSWDEDRLFLQLERTRCLQPNHVCCDSKESPAAEREQACRLSDAPSP